MNDIFYYGRHMSIKYGLLEAIKNIINLEGNCLQIFITSPLQTTISSKVISKLYNEYKNISEILQQKKVKLFIHSPYTYNFARPNINNNWLNCYWIVNYLKELEIASLINAVGCIIHVGKQLRLTSNEAINNMYESIRFVIQIIIKRNYSSIIILETCAGQGTELLKTSNNSLDLFSNFYNRFTDNEKQYLKICIDTCHIFSAGYCINNYDIIIKFFNEFKAKLNINNLALIHLNDSKKGCNSKVDRHENIGYGKIGLKYLKYFIIYAYIFKIPLILETPTIKKNEILIIKKTIQLIYNKLNKNNYH